MTMAETLSFLQEKRSTMTVDRFPTEIIEDILSRLPVKSIIRFRSVSKPWLSRISNPSFAKLHFTRATSGHRTTLFMSAYDHVTRKHHFLSAPSDGGLVTLLMTSDDSHHANITTEYLNGLVCFTCKKLFYSRSKFHAFVVNPSTRQIFTLPDPTVDCCSEYVHLGYLFGFDESRNEHKVLLIRKFIKSSKIEFMIFSMSNHSWRNVTVEPPSSVDFSRDRLSRDLQGGVCVNSVTHVMLQELSYDILAFDFITEKFAIISIPQGAVPHRFVTAYSRNGKSFMKLNKPNIMKINGCLGVVCHERVAESNGIDIWILQDYDNRVWVRETVEFPESWNEFGGPFPLPVDVHMDEIVFSTSKVSENVIHLPVYNMKTRCFKSVRTTYS